MFTGALPLNDYSVPTTYGHRDVLVRGYVHDVVISCGAEVIARHPRSYERRDVDRIAWAQRLRPKRHAPSGQFFVCGYPVMRAMLA